MAVRSTMAALIARVRQLINDSGSAIFTDQEVQDVLDACRTDIVNGATRFKPTFSGSTIQYLDYFTDLTDWEDDIVFKQYLITVVTPSVNEPIAGHWQFATSKFPPLFVTGKTYDVFKASADLLERWAAKVALDFDFSSDGQSFRRSQKASALLAMARQYRMQQRPSAISFSRSDLASGEDNGPSLGATALDYMAQG